MGFDRQYCFLTHLVEPNIDFQHCLYTQCWQRGLLRNVDEQHCVQRAILSVKAIAVLSVQSIVNRTKSSGSTLNIVEQLHGIERTMLKSNIELKG